MITKLDMGLAWNQAMAMLAANRQVVGIVAGLFLFLPGVILTIAAPQEDLMLAMSSFEPGQDPDAMMEMMNAFYAQHWWKFLLAAITQAIGMLALIALLANPARPTVAQALSLAAKSIPTYLVSLILISLALTLALMLPIIVGALIAAAVAVLLGMIAAVLMVYLLVKFSLLGPVIAVEQRLNPVAVLQRSWRATKGNSFRLFAFLLLLFVVYMVVGALSTMVFSILSIVGEEIGLFATAIGGAAISAIFSCVFLAAITAAHRQLTGENFQAVSETFE